MEKLESHIKEHLKTNLQDGYMKYWQAVHPFPFDPVEDFYRYTFTEEEWEMLQAMMDDLRPNGNLRECFNLRRNFRLFLTPNRYNGNGESIEFRLPYDLPYVGNCMLENFPAPAREKVQAWVDRWSLFERGRIRLEDFTREILYPCNTVGQVIRIWPITENFFPKYTQETYRRYCKVRSALPVEACVWEYSHTKGKNINKGVHPKYDCLQVKNIEKMLAGSTLLETELDRQYPCS